MNDIIALEAKLETMQKNPSRMTAEQGRLLSQQYKQKITPIDVPSLIEDQKVILKVPLKDRVHERAESHRSSQYVFMPADKEVGPTGPSAALNITKANS